MVRIVIPAIFFYFLYGCNFSNNGHERPTYKDSITKVEMNLSAFGVELHSFPSITATIDFNKNFASCTKTYYNPAIKSSTYFLTPDEIKKAFFLVKNADLYSLQSEYKVTKSDQPTSTTSIFAGQRIFITKDYGLEGHALLQELYKIVYKY